MQFPEADVAEKRANEFLAHLAPMLAKEAAARTAASPESGDNGGVIVEKGTSEIEWIGQYFPEFEQHPEAKFFTVVIPGTMLATLVAGGSPKVREDWAELLRGDLDVVPVLACMQGFMKIVGVKVTRSSRRK